MDTTAKKLEVFVIVTTIALIGIIYAFRQDPVPVPAADNPNVSLTDQDTDQGINFPAFGPAPVKPAPASPAIQQQVTTNIIEYKGVDGKNALELLESTHRVDAKHYSFGDLVTGIDGITPDAKHFWAMYVNGQFSQVGASAYATKSTDTIKWQIDAVVDPTKK